MFILPVLVTLVPFFFNAYELGNLLGEAKEEYEAAEWQCTWTQNYLANRPEHPSANGSARANRLEARE
ncbi:MAG: hypothetical protein CYPHOPRED_003519 [Cyphobasidiales sp. Tagirdzhanova-0007]|nr:MAG: hypothetical protein CYPHOPRED_003519 [Cyphobasidiales sp. Tagirdzhanova-0007]